METFKFNLDNIKHDIPKIMSRQQILDYFQISTTTLFRYETQHNFPKHKIGNRRKNFYKLNEVLDWFERESS